MKEADEKGYTHLGILEPTGRLAGWEMTLRAYDFSIVCRPGIKNAVADALSRIPEFTKENEEEKQIASSRVDPITDNMSELRRQQRADEHTRNLISFLEDGTLPINIDLAKKLTDEIG